MNQVFSFHKKTATSSGCILIIFCHKECSDVLKSMVTDIYVPYNTEGAYTPTHETTSQTCFALILQVNNQNN